MVKKTSTVKRKSTSSRKKKSTTKGKPSLYDNIKKQPKKYALIAAGIGIPLLQLAYSIKKQKDNEKELKALLLNNEKNEKNKSPLTRAVDKIMMERHKELLFGK